MRVVTGLSPVLALKSACIGKMRNFKKNVRVKGLKKLKMKSLVAGQFPKEGWTRKRYLTLCGLTITLR